MYRLAVWFGLAVAPSLAQELLGNDAIVKLVKSGLGEEVVVALINQQPGKYAAAPNDLIALKSAGVSDKIIAAMLARSAGAPQASTPQPTSQVDSVPAFAEIGVYHKKGGQWMEVLPDVVNWKTGGILKNVASAGVVKKDINGHLPGQHSRNSVKTPLEFMIYAPEGVAITEYQLIHLRSNSNKEYREFRTVTGGVFNTKSGAMRDMVPFEGKKVGNRLYSVILPATLGAGEYGFIYLGASGGAGGLTSLSMGKMYTFRLLE